MTIPEEQSPIIVEDDALRGGFTQIPNLILRNPDISPGAKVAYAVLLSYAWGKGSCFPGQETMARDMACAERSVRTYMGQLTGAGLIEVRHRGLGRTNLYIIKRLNPADFAAVLDTDRVNPAEYADQERQPLPSSKRQNLPPKNTQLEEDAIEEMKIDTPPVSLRSTSPTGDAPSPAFLRALEQSERQREALRRERRK